MTPEKSIEQLREKVISLATEAVENSNPTGWFDTLYQDANGAISQVPWAQSTAHTYIQNKLENNPPEATGKSAIVVGCGLGDDAEAIAKQGFQVTAFDISPTAIDWCQQRFPNSTVNYQVADLFKACDFVLLTYSSDFQSASGVLNTAIAYRRPCLASSGKSNLKNQILLLFSHK